MSITWQLKRPNEPPLHRDLHKIDLEFYGVYNINSTGDENRRYYEIIILSCNNY